MRDQYPCFTFGKLDLQVRRIMSAERFSKNGREMAPPRLERGEPCACELGIARAVDAPAREGPALRGAGGDRHLVASPGQAAQVDRRGEAPVVLVDGDGLAVHPHRGGRDTRSPRPADADLEVALAHAGSRCEPANRAALPTARPG